MSTSRNLVFIGFMGVGKSTFAKHIATQLDRLYIDTDQLIETSCSSSVSDIFADKGEVHFRQMESKVFDFLLPTQNACLSLGGGFPIYSNRLVKELGVVVYLSDSIDNILSRLSDEQIQKRPLLQERQKAVDLFQTRIPIYEQNSHIILPIKNHSISELTKIFFDKLKALNLT